jgi:hypothetical protein
MKEYGSDYHKIDDYAKGESLTSMHKNCNFYASGRQSLYSIIKYKQWKRIWMPSYFCYEVNDAIHSLIEIKYYSDFPLADDTKAISEIPFEEGDVLLRMNYFGIRKYRDESNVQVSVIEDHSHDLIGDWALHSNADWCIASLRKTLPISEGGILWSPKGNALPVQPYQTKENQLLSVHRFEAMKLKTDFLNEAYKDKEYFRTLYVSTENEFESLPISDISSDSRDVVKDLDIKDWYFRKQNNWKYLSTIEGEDVEILKAESKNCNLFSLVLKFRKNEERERVRDILIKKQCVYPAVLWNIPNPFYKTSVDFGDTMLSIHCDARYDKDLEDLKQRIVSAIRLAREK